MSKSSPLQGFFLDRSYAITVPALAMVGAVTVAGLFIASVLLRSKSAAAPAAESKKAKKSK